MPIPLGLVGYLALGIATTAMGDEPTAPVTPEQTDFFEARIRPVLVEKCRKCHGPDEPKFGLRLDSRAALLQGGDAGPVVTPGDPESSPLIEAVRHAGPVRMPPKEKLPPQAIADLEAWVKMGLPWPESPKPTAAATEDARPDHWAFQLVHRPDLPAVQAASWPRNEIDRFVLARLEAADLAPSPPADRRTLIRRVSFDLIGLPPTPGEVEAFVNDPAPDAYERLISRLLDSPRYGERWGRYWLDVARFADTKGYVFFEEVDYPFAYTYRDYVIDALNDDKPYDRFLLEQLAADKLDLGDDRRPLAAMGFLTAGGRFINNQHDIIDDRIDVVTRGLMGLTVTCARCHDHKFDPIPSEDYYSLYGVFASSTEPNVPPLFEPTPQTDEYRAFAKQLEAREAKLAEFVRTKHEQLVSGSRRRAGEYLKAAHQATMRPSTEDFMLIADGGDLNPTMLVRWQKYLERTKRVHHPVFAPWQELAALPDAEFAAGAAELAKRLRGPTDPDKPINPIVAAALSESPPASMDDLAKTYGHILNRVEWIWQDYARRTALNGQAAESLPDPALEELRLVFHGADAPPDVPMNPVGDLALLPDRPSQEELKKLLKDVETWRSTGPGAPPRAMVLIDKPEPIEPRVFLRGNPNRPGSAVPRRFLRVLSGHDRQPFRDGSGRFDLARAIIDPENPLTARVLVNRVWLHHFAAPLVGTPGDFGLRGDPPTHPELLDWLASTFVADGWSLKKLHRRILLSATYQQASDTRSEASAIDPENRLLWRMNRRRLDFEATRDALLAVADHLDPAVGGPSTKDITAPTSTRRTLYGYLDRLNLPGLYRTFDFPDPNATSPQRSLTTVPPQALFLMNHPLVLALARDTLQRPDVTSEGATAAKVDGLYRLLYSREPTVEERSLADSYLKAAGGGEVAWERYVQALLLTNEFVYID